MFLLYGDSNLILQIQFMILYLVALFLKLFAIIARCAMKLLEQDMIQI